jgi:transposase
MRCWWVYLVRLFRRSWCVSSKPWIVNDALWAVIEPLPPAWPERSPGPRLVEDRRCRQSILFVLCTGITWQQLSLLGSGSGRTCWRLFGRWARGRGLRPVYPSSWLS